MLFERNSEPQETDGEDKTYMSEIDPELRERGQTDKGDTWNTLTHRQRGPLRRSNSPL